MDKNALEPTGARMEEKTLLSSRDLGCDTVDISRISPRKYADDADAPMESAIRQIKGNDTSSTAILAENFGSCVSEHTKLFVGNLAWKTTEKSLKEAFSRFDTISTVNVVFDRCTGRSRGFGFVTFTSVQDAASAKSNMNGKYIDGRQIRVEEALSNK